MNLYCIWKEEWITVTDGHTGKEWIIVTNRCIRKEWIKPSKSIIINKRTTNCEGIIRNQWNYDHKWYY